MSINASKLFCIHKSVLGDTRNILFNVDDEGRAVNVQLVEEIPKDSFLFKREISESRPDTDLSLNVAFSLEKMEANFLPIKQKYINMMSDLRVDILKNDVKWSTVMSKEDYRDYIEKLVFGTAKTIHGTNFEYFYGTYVPTTHVFESLCRPYIDTVGVKSCDRPTLNAMNSARVDSESGASSKIIYDRLATRTGRLKVKSGINVLTFPKSSRSLFKSSYRSGSVIAIDFKSIEARVAWTATGNPCEDDDIYEMINKKYFDSRLERSIVKIAVLSLLYGRGAKSLSENLGCSIKNAEKFIDLIKKKFDVGSVVSRLSSQFELEGYIRNFYSRRINLPDDKKHIMYNSYVQSTAVDVVLLGVMQMIERIDKDIRPLFMIHDEIFFDCPNDLIDSLLKISNDVSVELHGMNLRLPTKATRV